MKLALYSFTIIIDEYDLQAAKAKTKSAKIKKKSKKKIKQE
jgi:hypothetical protein